MKVSVITPVFNAEKFVTRAVESALAQPETGEVLLIEDGSPDNGLAVCQALAKKYDKVILMRHPNGENRGPGASRNLGMRNAAYEFIAFLDADDYYLPGRFIRTRHVFAQNPRCEGVYEAVGFQIRNESALLKWEQCQQGSTDKLITMKAKINPDHLGVSLISGCSGYFSLDGFVIMKIILGKTGEMSVQLHLHQDTEWLIRCALTAHLYPGRLDDPVSIVGIHEQNRFFSHRTQAREYHNRMKYWFSLYHWAKINSPQDIQKLILKSIIKYTRGHKFFRNFPREYFPTRLIRIIRLLRLIGYPEIILDAISIKK